MLTFFKFIAFGWGILGGIALGFIGLASVVYSITALVNPALMIEGIPFTWILGGDAVFILMIAFIIQSIRSSR